MSFFSNLFSSETPLEAKLLQDYAPALCQNFGMPATDAQKYLRGFISDFRKSSADEQVPNLGDRMLTLNDPSLKQKLDAKRQEGVRDADFRWWWNMPELERYIIAKIDDFYRVTGYITFQESGMSDEDALIKLRKFNPMYGDINDTSNTIGDDRPLPIELKDRVNTWIQSQQSPDRFKMLLESASSFNALVRALIRKGSL